jgi:hypothetical protein
VPTENYANVNDLSTLVLNATVATAPAQGTVETWTVVATTGMLTTGQYRGLIQSEIIILSYLSATTISVIRGQEGTATATHANGLTIDILVTRDGIRNLLEVQQDGVRLGDIDRTLNFRGVGGFAELSGGNALLHLLDYAGMTFADDDFIVGGNSVATGIGKLNWTSAAGGNPTVIAGEAGHPGILNKSTNATAITTQATVNMRGSAGTGSLILEMTSAIYWEAHFLIRPKIVNTDVNTLYRIGFGNDSTANPPNDGVFIEKLPADVNFFAVCRAASVQTKDATGLDTTGTGTKTWNGTTDWLHFKMRKVNTTTIGFSINGRAERTLAANVPTVALNAFFGVGNNNTAAAKTLDIDYFAFIMTGLSR